MPRPCSVACSLSPAFAAAVVNFVLPTDVWLNIVPIRSSAGGNIGGTASVSEGPLQYRKARFSIGRLAAVSEGSLQYRKAAVRSRSGQPCGQASENVAVNSRIVFGIRIRKLFLMTTV